MKNTQTIQLNSPTDTLLVFGGVYSNLQALEQLYKVANELDIKPEQIICTGDIVGYCAQPEACVQLIKKWGIHAIAGNVEIQLRENQEDCGCDFSEDSNCARLSKEWYPFAESKLSEDSIEWMHTLPNFLEFEYGGKRVRVVHGSYKYTSEFVFYSTNWDTKLESMQNIDMVLAGHSGLPFTDRLRDKTWINVGSLGMPANDGTQRVWYSILDQKSIMHKALEYDYKKAAEQMQLNNLPKTYAKTLSTGIWDNCEILPEEETKAQGIKIVL